MEDDFFPQSPPSTSNAENLQSDSSSYYLIIDSSTSSSSNQLSAAAQHQIPLTYPEKLQKRVLRDLRRPAYLSSSSSSKTCSQTDRLPLRLISKKMEDRFSKALPIRSPPPLPSPLPTFPSSTSSSSSAAPSSSFLLRSDSSGSWRASIRKFPRTRPAPPVPTLLSSLP